MAGERVLPGIGIRAFWTPGSNGWNDEHDADTRTISALVQCNVISRVAAVPGSPSDGDIHILTAAPNLNAIALRDNGAWVYLQPQEGWLAYDRSADALLRFTGSNWRVVVPAVTLGAAGQFLRVNAAGTETEWADPAGSVSLDSLSDVTITGTPSLGQIIRYNGSEWANAAISLSLDNLTDVVITGTPTVGQVIRHDGTNWVNDTIPGGGGGTLDSLSDVVVTSPVDGQFLFYNGSTWLNAVIALDVLSDVVISSPSDGQFMRYDGVDGRWENVTVSILPDAPNDGTPYVRRNLAWEPVQRNLDVNSQAGNYTLVIGDRLGYIRMTSGSANNLTVPNNSTVPFPVGTVIQVRQAGAGKTTIVAAGGVTVNSPATLNARRQGSGLALVKVGTNEWDLTGDVE